MVDSKKIQPAKDTGKKVQKAKETPIVSTSAGEYIAKTWAYGTSGFQLIQELDSAIAALANIDFSDAPGCKGVKPVQSKSDKPFDFVKETGNLLKDAGKAIPGCAPFINDDFASEDKDTADVVLESTLAALNFLITAEDRFPACAEEQFRRFLAIIPVQYYLLLLLSKVASKVSDFDVITQQIDTPCGTSFEQIKEFKSRIPQVDIPLIPELPYINIPDIQSNLDRFIYELLCVGICSVTTAVIQRVAPLLTDSGDDLKRYLFAEDPENIVSLRKIPITPYITPAALEAARKNDIIPFNVSDEQVLEYLEKIQKRDDVGQEEYVFLFLGQAKCNILLKVQAEKDTEDLLKLNSDNKIVTFFSFLGSFINFIDLLENSKGKICPPDPCDIKPNEIEGILATVTDLCRLLNPEQGLPPLPLGSMMDALGANEFIVDSTYESYKTIPTLNESYQPYINDFFTQGQSVIDKLLKLSVDSDTDFVAINVDDNNATLSIFTKFKVKIPPFVKIEKVVPKQQILTDNNLKFDEFDKAIQQYWLDGELSFKEDQFLISNYSADTGEVVKQQTSDFMRRYLEVGFPFAVLSLLSADIPANSDVDTYYDGWNFKDTEFFADGNNARYNPGNPPVKFNGYLRYTKPVLRNQLKDLQKDTKVDVSSDEGKEQLNENIKFAILKQEFGL
jgi:hypothetical protein